MAGPFLVAVIVWKISWVRAGLPGPLHTSSKFQNASDRNGPAAHLDISVYAVDTYTWVHARVHAHTCAHTHTCSHVIHRDSDGA